MSNGAATVASSAACPSPTAVTVWPSRVNDAREHVAQRRVVVDDEDAEGGGGRGAHRASRTMTTHAAALMSVTPIQRMRQRGARQGLVVAHRVLDRLVVAMAGGCHGESEHRERDRQRPARSGRPSRSRAWPARRRSARSRS